MAGAQPIVDSSATTESSVRGNVLVVATTTRAVATLVETQPAFDTYLEHYHSSSLAWDQIHPDTTGHMIIAKAFLEEVSLDS